MLYSQRVVRRRNAIPLVILVPEKPFTITLYLKKKTVQMGDITMKMSGSPIIADDNHAEDRAGATEGPEKGVDVAEELA